MEDHFLELLRIHLQSKVRTLAVCGKQEDGAATLDRLVKASVPIEPRDPYQGGFSEFIVARGMDAFLGS